MTKEYEQRQAHWIEKNKICDGDRVRVVREAITGEDGWDNSWVRGMGTKIGQVGAVLMGPVLDSYGLYVDFGVVDEIYQFPYFVLENAPTKTSIKVPVDSN